MNMIPDITIGRLAFNYPSWHAMAIGALLSMAWTSLWLWLMGYLKQKGIKTAYTRKIFHSLMFATVAVLQWQLGVWAVFLFGSVSSLVIFLAMWRGPGNVLYEAIARERDSPDRTLFIVIPCLATFAGLLIVNVLFSPTIAITGYLVTGLGDAIGEPVGTKFGRHPYRVNVPFSSVPTTRSLEGSAAVFIMSAIALFIAILISPQITLATSGILKIFVIAAICSLAEALSPHGWDNATMQIVPAALVWMWMV